MEITDEEILNYFSKTLSVLTEYKITSSLNNIFPMPLFHGTDKKVLHLDNKEISKIKKNNKISLLTLFNLLMINHFNPFSDDFSVKSPLDPNKEIKKQKAKEFEKKGELLFGQEVYWNIVHAIEHASSIAKENKTLWNYDYFFVTSGLRRAHSYATKSAWYGKLGYFTHWLYVAVKELNISLTNITEEEREAIEFIESIFNNVSEPIILCINNLKIEDLKDEDGKSTTLVFSTQNSYRVLKDMDIHSYPYMEISTHTAYDIDEKLEQFYQSLRIIRSESF